MPRGRAIRRRVGRRPESAVRRGAMRRRVTSRRFSLSAQQERARVRLRVFRQGSALAVSVTALLLMVAGVADESAGQQVPPAPAPELPLDPSESIEQATGTIRELLLAFYGVLPKLALALVLVATAAIVARMTSGILRRTIGRWEKAEAVSAWCGSACISPRLRCRSASSPVMRARSSDPSASSDWRCPGRCRRRSKVLRAGSSTRSAAITALAIELRWGCVR